MRKLVRVRVRCLPFDKTNLKVYPNFSILCWFFTSDGQVWACAAKSRSSKNRKTEKQTTTKNPKPKFIRSKSLRFIANSQPLSFAPYPLRTDLLGSTPGSPLPAHSLCLPCPISASQRAAQSCISSAQPRIATVAKHVRKFYGKTEMDLPARKLWQNITSLETLRIISGILTTTRDRKWPTTHNAAPFLIWNDSRLSRQLILCQGL